MNDIADPTHRVVECITTMWTKQLYVVLVGAISVLAATYQVDVNNTQASEPGESFVSFSIELSSFPEYAGMLTKT